MKATKALKPSKMGLHSTIRFTVEPEGENRSEQEKNIINYVTSLHEFLQSSGIPEEQSEIFTWKFARFVSKAFRFKGYQDDEVFQILARAVDRNRKKWNG